MRRIALLAFLGIAAGVQANLVPNGNFELNTVGGGFGDTSDGWSVFPDVFAGGTPDTWDNGGVNGNAPGSATVLTGVTAYEGKKWIGLGAENSPNFSEGIESSSFVLTSGTIYRLSLAMLYDDSNNLGYNNPASLTVRLRTTGASSILTVFGPPASGRTWETRSFDFVVGTSDNYTLILSNEDTAKSYIAVDAVNLVVPEPATMAALAMGGLALMRRRRR